MPSAKAKGGFSPFSAKGKVLSKLRDAELDAAGIREAGVGCCRESCSVPLQTQSKDLAAKPWLEMQAEHLHGAPFLQPPLHQGEPLLPASTFPQPAQGTVMSLL